MLKNNFSIFKNGARFSSLRYLSVESTVSPVKTKESAKSNMNFEDALPFENVPTISAFTMIKNFMPGGKWYNIPRRIAQEQMFEEYGELMRIPSIFGRREVLLTNNPNSFEVIFRTEGIWPFRNSLDTLHHYRKEKNPEAYKNPGLLVQQHEEWGQTRSMVNPILMQPRAVKFYIPRMSQVADEFIERIRNLRDKNSQEVPPTFLKEINNWALESVCLVALDTRLGLINESNKNPDAKKVIEAISTFFTLSEKLDVKPSIWKFFATPNYKKLMKAYDTLTEISTKYINSAMERYEKYNSENDTRAETDKSVLERLLKLDKNIAIVMAMDMIMAGVDTTGSAIVGSLLALSKNPDKQDKLRKEILAVLPQKNSELTAENMQKLPYLRACIKEAMRVYPIASGTVRRTNKEIILNGYKIPKNVDVAIMTLGLINNDKYFPSAKEFIPERWLRNKTEDTNKQCPNATKSLNPFVYIPFGIGPRMCVGKRLVDLELEILISKIIRNFEVEFNYSDENLFTLNLINVPTGDLNFKFKNIDE